MVKLDVAVDIFLRLDNFKAFLAKSLEERLAGCTPRLAMVDGHAGP